jgi:hypothetical protein
MSVLAIGENDFGSPLGRMPIPRAGVRRARAPIRD